MKKLLLFLVGLFAVLNVHADSQENKDGINYTETQIIGAFGFVLGETPPKGTIRKGNEKSTKEKSDYKDRDGNIVYYAVKAPESFAHISQYDLTVTPETKKIAKIYAVFGTDDKDVAADFYKDLSDGLTAKYGVFTVAKSKYSEGESIVFINKNNPKRKIRISIEKRDKGYTCIRFEYFDIDLLKAETKPNFKAL